MPDKIDNFKAKEFEFMSNFHMVDVEYDGETWPSSEHAFQAAKTEDKKEKLKIKRAKTAAEAKKLGSKVTMRKDWNEVKLFVMQDILFAKFSNEDLREKLLATGDAELIEGNWWGDTYWGVCKGVGSNYLGKLLMKVRKMSR